MWVAELDGRAVGAITLRDLGGGVARLADLALLPEARGSGTGRRLVEAALAAARAAAYRQVELLTFSELVAGARALPPRRLRADEQRAPAPLGTRARLGALGAGSLACAA